jgi:hypothetical protein
LGLIILLAAIFVRSSAAWVLAWAANIALVAASHGQQNEYWRMMDLPARTMMDMVTSAALMGIFLVLLGRTARWLYFRLVKRTVEPFL